MKVPRILFLVLTLVVVLAGCSAPPAGTFPPPEGYSSWDEYYNRETSTATTTPPPQQTVFITQPPVTVTLPPVTVTIPPVTITVTTTVIPTVAPSSVTVYSLTYTVPEANSVWWKFSWKLQIQNLSNLAAVVDVNIGYYNAAGYLIEDSNEYDLHIPPLGITEFTGYDLVDIDIAPRVNSIRAILELR